MSDLKQQGIKAFIWDFSGKLATQGAGFVITIFLARLLDPADFGLIAMIMVIIGMASVFSDVGLGSALIQQKRVLPIHYTSVFYFNLLLALLLTSICYVSAEWIAAFYQNLDLIPLTQVMSLLFFINACGCVQATKLRKELNYKTLTKISFLSSLVGGITGLTLAFKGFGVWSLVFQTLIAGTFSNILLWSFSRWHPDLQFSFKALRQLWKFGFRMFLASLLNEIFTRLDYLIIGKIFSAETLGFFQRAKSLNLLIVQYSSGSLMSVLFPILVKLKNNKERFESTAINVLHVIVFSSFIMLGFLYVTAEDLINLLFGQKWQASVNYFEILVLSGFGYPVGALLINILSSKGCSGVVLRIQTYKNAINTLNLCIGFIWGIEGYLYGLIAVTAINLTINILAVCAETGFEFMVFLKPILSQATITLISVSISRNTGVFFETSQHFFSLMNNAIFFFLSFFLINFFAKTSSYITIKNSLFNSR